MYQYPFAKHAPAFGLTQERGKILLAALDKAIMEYPREEWPTEEQPELVSYVFERIKDKLTSAELAFVMYCMGAINNELKWLKKEPE